LAGDYDKAITIERALQSIVERRYLLPSIQRNFTWSHEQICALFDSIMRNYPINSFMLWEVESARVQEEFRFYSFLERYVERFHENNEHFDIKGHGTFFAVIDGQQRLTSLYIGLKGSYAYKTPRTWWPKANDPSVLPPRKLYLNLEAQLDPEQNENLLLHDFRFLTVTEVEEHRKQGAKGWFEVGKVLELAAIETADEVTDVAIEHLESMGITGNSYARKTLVRLYAAVRLEASLVAYVEHSQEIDHVLDIFIRTNKGGTPLSFSDLLMSITTAHWEDAREQVDQVVNQIRTDLGFSINRDLIMKTAVTVIDTDVRFQVKNFGDASVTRIRDDWEDIRDSIVEAFRLVSAFGLNDGSLRAKNAVIPIVYYLFHKGRAAGHGSLFESINSPIRNADDRLVIRRWLLMSLLRGVFGFAGDALLTSLRTLIRSHLDEPVFPLGEIESAYAGTNRDITFDDEFIDRLLRTQKDDPASYAILALLQPQIDINQRLHLDHLHPASAFTASALGKMDEQDPARRAFYGDRENWNSIANLHLLSESENTSKNASPLDVWMAQRDGKTLLDPMIPAGTDLSFARFPEFVAARSEYLRERLTSLVGKGSKRSIDS